MAEKNRQLICWHIHIPSDAPGFLRDQSLVTSGLVPRSVSREALYIAGTRLPH
ncbi:MAG: hypothetical protein LBF66_01145 [Holosporales bacterium]|nr:hypothetical protein [Holosporales bacterium]